MPAKVRNKYNPQHRATRKALEPAVATGTVRCWRCGEYITSLQHWDLGHRDALPSHPEHQDCNRSAGAADGNRKRRPTSHYFGSPSA